MNGFHLTAGQKDYEERLVQMEEGVKQYYRQNGIPPGVPTQNGSNADPYVTGIALPNVPLGNYDVPSGWPTAVRFNPPGDVPGPPVQFESDEMGDPGAGYGFESDRTYEGDWFFFHSDHLGSTSYLTDTAGNVSQFVCYTPYGEAIVDEHLTTYENPFKFSGKELDDITGLYDHGARNRDPITAVWYGIDELFENDPDKSPFHYCGGNPVKFVDMDGREKHILFDKNDVNRIKSAENIIDDPCIIGLHQHGSNLGILNGKDNETYTTPAELLNYLEKNSAKWQAHNRTEVENCINDEIIIDAEPIVLQFFSCNTGKGENSYAQQVSAAEGFENVLVIAADENVNTRIVNGVTYVNVLKKGNGEKPSNRETGSWRFFLNGKEILSKKLKFDETLKFNIKEIPFKQYKGLIPLHPCKAFNQK